MTIQLEPIFSGDSQLFKVRTYDTDGVTLITALSCTCTVFDRRTEAEVLASTPGAVGAGYAQYNWAGTSTPGLYEALLTVTLASGVVKSENFIVEVRDRPPAFTTDLATDIGLMRMELGDDVQGTGVKPDGRNLSDGECQVLLTREGSVMPAVAAACELLARLWARVANISVGSRREDLAAISDQWAKQAAKLREQYGAAAGSVTAFSVGVKRQDGYADAGTEYTA